MHNSKTVTIIYSWWNQQNVCHKQWPEWELIDLPHFLRSFKLPFCWNSYPLLFKNRQIRLIFGFWMLKDSLCRNAKFYILTTISNWSFRNTLCWAVPVKLILAKMGVNKQPPKFEKLKIALFHQFQVKDSYEDSYVMKSFIFLWIFVLKIYNSFSNLAIWVYIAMARLHYNAQYTLL